MKKRRILDFSPNLLKKRKYERCMDWGIISYGTVYKDDNNWILVKII